MKVSILAYHAANILGNDYNTNDHIALIEDIKLFQEMGVVVISASTIVAWIKGKRYLDENKNYVAITFDDGNQLDFTDSKYFEYGLQKSFYTILCQSKIKLHATSFVIASPQARKILEKTCLGGQKLLGEKWWQEAENTGIISIENHSWDHVHPSLENVCQKDNLKGDFSKIDCYKDADFQIEKASNYIENSMQNKSISLFAYPFGHYNQYLSEEYFPNCQSQIKAAFTCDPEPVTRNTNVWKIPRYVCGADWKSVEELKKIIA